MVLLPCRVRNKRCNTNYMTESYAEFKSTSSLLSAQSNTCTNQAGDPAAAATPTPVPRATKKLSTCFSMRWEGRPAG